MINIRKAIIKDQEIVGNLFKEMVDFHSERDSIFTLTPTGHERYAKWLVELISDESALPLVAEYNGEVVGFCTSLLKEYPKTWTRRYYGEILDIGVEKDYRRKGIGTELLKNSIEWFKKRLIESK